MGSFCFDFHFGAIVEDELDVPVWVHDALLNHDRPDGIVPFRQDGRLLFQLANE